MSGCIFPNATVNILIALFPVNNCEIIFKTVRTGFRVIGYGGCPFRLQQRAKKGTTRVEATDSDDEENGVYIIAADERRMEGHSSIRTQKPSASSPSEQLT